MSMGSEDTFIFSVLLQTKIRPPLMQGLGVYVTKPGKYAMVLREAVGRNASELQQTFNKLKLLLN